MNIKKKETRGRKPVAARRRVTSVTMSEEHYLLLERLAKLTGSSVAAFVRQMVVDSAPNLKNLAEALEEAEKGNDEKARQSAAVAIIAASGQADKLLRELKDVQE